MYDYDGLLRFSMKSAEIVGLRLSRHRSAKWESPVFACITALPWLYQSSICDCERHHEFQIRFCSNQIKCCDSNCMQKRVMCASRLVIGHCSPSFGLSGRHS